MFAFRYQKEIDSSPSYYVEEGVFSTKMINKGKGIQG